MFISIDSVGRVIINSVQKKLFVMVANKHVIVDPLKNIGVASPFPFTSVACRFHSQMHGQGIYDDMAIFALAAPDRVLLGEAKAASHSVFHTLPAPAATAPHMVTQQSPKPTPTTVALAWGHGMTPANKERAHSLLAVAWGPYIQIVVMIDHEDRDKPFFSDGYYILRQLKTSVEVPVTTRNVVLSGKAPEERKEIMFDADQLLEEMQKLPELQIEAIQFISDSTILLATSSADIRVVHTH
jgi:hypothetical protein